MDESKLKIFTSVARHKSFNKAARELNVVSSTISRQIAALEDELDAQLFYRDTHSVELTPAGKRLLNASFTYFELFEYVNGNVHNLIHRDEHRINITCAPFEFPLVSRLVDQYRQCDPDVALQMSIYHVYDGQALENGTANFFVTGRPFVRHLENYQWTSLGTYRCKAVARKDSPFWDLPPDKQAVLWQQKLVRPANGVFTPVTLWLPDHPLENRGTAFSQRFVVTSSYLYLDGVALMPEYTEPWLPPFLRMEQVFPEPPEFEAVLVFNPTRSTPQEHQFFRYIRDNFKP